MYHRSTSRLVTQLFTAIFAVYTARIASRKTMKSSVVHQRECLYRAGQCRWFDKTFISLLKSCTPCGDCYAYDVMFSICSVRFNWLARGLLAP